MAEFGSPPPPRGHFSGAFAASNSKTIHLPAGVTKIAFGANGANYKDNGVLKILDPVVK